MEKGLMCSACYADHAERAKAAIRAHKPAEGQLDFAIRRNTENLTLLGEELSSKMEQTRAFFGEAHSEVASECREAGLRFDRNDSGQKAEFLDLVKARYQEIMLKAGQEELYNRVEWLKDQLHTGEDKLRWYEKLATKREEAVA